VGRVTASRDPLAFLRHGQTPFFRLGIDRANADDLADVARGADAVLLGVPFDGGTTIHPGARHAPFSVRQQSVLLPGHEPLLHVDVFDELIVRDGGNVALTPFSPALMRECVQLEVGAVLRAGAAPFVVGGDHSISLPCLRAAHAVHGPLALVHFDAHADVTDDDAWLESHHHGTWLRHALDEGLVAPGALVQVGVRGPFKSGGELDRVHAAGGLVLSADDVFASWSAARDAMAHRCGENPVWISFDVDAVDPAYAPGTGVRVCGGLTSREALALVRGLAGRTIVGFDVVEVCPALDSGDITSLLAAHLLFTGLAAFAVGRRRTTPRSARA
jgi:agmatinase